MTEKFYICQLDELADPGSYGFSVSHAEQTIEGFVVQKDGRLYAYRNICPHTGSPLDWVEHQFLDLDMAFIQCAVHDARFEIEDGSCVAGPCNGEALQSLSVMQQDNEIFLQLDPE